MMLTRDVEKLELTLICEQNFTKHKAKLWIRLDWTKSPTQAVESDFLECSVWIRIWNMFSGSAANLCFRSPKIILGQNH